MVSTFSVCFLSCWGHCREIIQVNDAAGSSKSFIVLKRLDFGGFSTIELVAERSTRDHFVLKRMVCHSKDDETRHLSEANFHLHLSNHPNILTCFGVGMRKLSSHPQHAISEVLMVLQYSEKGTLQKEINRRRFGMGHFPLKLVLKFIDDICEALSFLLSADVPMSHRDIKPGNLLIFENWRLVLMDFGSATPSVLPIQNYKDAEKWRDFAAENCSMTYRAPEFFQPKVHQNITEKADIWSLGCLFYALFAFESPLDPVYARGDSVALAVCSSNIQFPERIFSGIPLIWVELIISMLNIDPNKRPTLEAVQQLIKPVLTDFIPSGDVAVHRFQPGV